MSVEDGKFDNSYCFCQDYGSSTTECVSGDCFGEVREVDLADLKQESDYVCFLCHVCNAFSALMLLVGCQEVHLPVKKSD